MSTTIDSRVVEMRFDNKHFENNVSTTMSTLDKLKQKLHLDGATKGLESVNSAAKKVDISGLGTAVESVQAKFSAMQVIGVTALANITNSAVNAGKRMIKALTLDPITTGFSEYETQINATQTILANTASKGSDINDVNKALEELNAYADKTIYNFTEMTRNIGTFTAAGIDLDTSVNAIQGIANLAAVSGSTSQQASTAMYQLSQALSTGTVRLMDWNSVVNAGMGGEMFQNALKKTSELLGTGAEAAIKAKGSFRESLSEGWLTAEVLTRTLKTFTTSGANEYVAEYTGLSKEAVDAALKEAEARYGEAEAIDHAAEALSKKSGKNKKEIKDALQFAKNAEDAATKVKTFTQLWDVLKESAQSGWSQTWKLIVGDFEEAKALLTPLADLLTGFINNISDWRNRILQVALDSAAPWKAISDKISKITDTVTGVTDAVSGALKPLEYFQDVVDRVWMGEFNNWGDNPDRRDLLKAAGYDPRVVQYLVNLGEEAWHSGKVYKLSMEEVEAAHKKYGLTVKSTKEETEKVTTAFNELSDEQLKNAGLTKDEIALYRALEEEADRAGISISDLAKEMSETDGRTMLVDSFKNIGGAILDMGNAIKSAWISIFNPPSAEVLGIRLYGIIRSLKEFTESLRLTDEKTGELNATGLKFQSVFKGIFAAIDIVLTVVGGPLKIVFKAATQLLGYFGLGVLDVAAFIGDAIVRFRDWIDSVLDFTKVFDKIIPPIENAIETFRNWIASLRESENLPQDIAKGIMSALGKAVDFIGNLFGQIWSSLKNGFSDTPGDIISGFVNGIWKGIKIVGQVIAELATAALDKFREVLGIHSPSKETYKDGQNFILGFWNGLKDLAGNVWGYIKDFGAKCIEVIRNIDFGAVFAAVMGLGLVRGFNKIADGIAGFGGIGEAVEDVLENTGKVLKSFSGVLKSMALENIANSVKTFAIALGILVVALVALAYVCGKDEFNVWEAVGVIATLAGVLAGLAVAMGYLSKSAIDIGKEGVKINNLTNGLISIGVAVLLLAFTVKIIGSMDPDTAEAGFKGLGAVILAIVGVLVACRLLTTGDTAGTVNGIGKTIFKISLAMLMLVGVAKLIAGMSRNEMGKAALGMAGLVLIITVLMQVANNAGMWTDKVGGTILKISVAIGLLVFVAKLIAGMSWDEMGKAAAGLGGLVGIVAALMLVTRLAGGKEAKIGGTILSIAGAMLMMIFIIQLVSKMDEKTLLKGVVVIGIFGAIIAALIKTTNKAGEHAGKAGAAMLTIALAVGVLALVATLLGLVKIKHLAKGIVAVGLLAAMVSAMIIACRGVNDIKGNLIVLTVAIGLLTGALVGLSFIDTTKLATASLALAAVMGMFALMTKAASSGQSSLGSLVVLSLVVTLLATVLWGLSTLKVDNTLGVAASLGALLLAMSSALLILSKVKMDKGAWVAITAIAVLGAVVLELGWVLSLVNKMNVGNALPAVTSISVLLGALTGVLAGLAKIGKTISSGDMLKTAAGLGVAVVGIAALGLVVLELGWVLSAINKMDIGNAMPMVMSLSVLLGALTIVLAACAGLGMILSSGSFLPAAGMAIAVAGLAALGLVVLELGWVLSAINKMDIGNAMPMVQTLSALLIVLTGVLAILTIIGLGTASALGGVVALAALGLVVWELGAILNVLKSYNLGDAMPTVEVLSTLLKNLTGVLAILTIIGLFAGAAIAGVISLTTMVTVLGGLMVALGWLFTQCESLEGFLDKGIEILNKIAFGLGAAIGNLINGFMGAVGNSMIMLGMQLSGFMVALQPFIIGIKLVDEKVLAGAGILTAAIIALTVADFVNGIMSIGGLGLPLLGTQLSMFMMNAMPFIAGAAMVSPEMLSGVKALADTILILTAANVIEGLTSWLTGGSSLASFASQLPILGQGLAAFSSSLGVFTEEQLATVKCAAQAVKTLAQAAAEIPNTGGLIASIVGENDLSMFASQFPILGTGLSQFLTNVGTFTDEQVATVDCAAKAIKTLAQASSEIPNSGGWLGQIVGENDLSMFASQFPVLGTGLAQFLTNVGTFTDDQVATVDCAAKAIKTLAQASSEIPNSGGWLAQIVGENDLGVFASQFPALGTGLSGFLSNVGTFTDEQVATVDCAAKAIKVLASTAGSIPNSGGIWQKIVGENDLGDFASKFPSIGKGIKGFVTELGSFTSAEVATVNSGIDAVNAISGLAKADLKSAAKNISGFGDKLIAFAEDISTFCSDMPSTTDLDIAINNLNSLLFAIEDVGLVNSGALSTFANNLKTVSEDAIKKFVGAFKSDAAKTDLRAAAKTLAQQAVHGFEDKSGDAKNAGKDLGNGLVAGIEAKYTAAYNAGYILGQMAVQGEKDGQQSNSPSKLTIKAGKWLGEGLVVGMQQMGDKVYGAGADLGKTATNTISSSISRIASAINTDIDSQPTIRPVLDLTDVKTGASALSSMLDMNSSVGVHANLGAISSMMSVRSQNGANDDVVSAIDKLRKDLSNIGGNTTYQVNGVTYDDGSNITEAVGNLVRAIKIEGRV